MNALIKGGAKHLKVHVERNGHPACGGGRGGKAAQWQVDLWPVSCLRCKRMAAAGDGETKPQMKGTNEKDGQ